MNLKQRDKASIWHPFSHYQPERFNRIITKAKGEFLYDEDGNEIIDSVASWWVNLHGHAHPKIAEAIHQQANELEHVIFAGFSHKPAIDLADRLLELLPENQSKLFFSDNGSTSTEIALKLAIQSFSNQGIRRSKIFALEGAYHGDTLGAMSAGDRGLFTAPFDNYLYEVVHLPLPTEENREACIQQLKQELANGQGLAFIFEPLLQAAGGMRMYSPKVLSELLELCHEAGVITIADEVVTAFYRTGPFLGSNHLSQTPDIICMAKGVTGGTMAMGVTACSEKIVKAFETEDRSKTFYHGHSFTGNPIACAAANASLEILASAESQQQRAQLASFFSDFKREIESLPGVENCRLLGHILAFDFKSDESNYLSNLRDWLYDSYLEQGILMRPLGNTVCFLPPYCICLKSLEKIKSVTLQLLAEAELA